MVKIIKFGKQKTRIQAMNVNENKEMLLQRSAKWGKRALRAFTLIELLVVIAITTIILTLLFAPLIQGFNFTRRARAIAAAQDSARTGLSIMRRELSQAAYIFDNTNTPVSLPIQATQIGDANRLPTSLFPAATAGTTTSFSANLSFTKLDLVLPARSSTVNQVADPTSNSTVNTDPNTGAVTSVGANVRFPLAPGTHVVRYFIGLRRNLDAAGNPAYYQNPYEFRRTDNDFNPFILYRAEFDARDPLLFSDVAYGSAEANSGGFNDPNFFYNTKPAPGGGTYAANWAKAAQPVIDNQNLDLLVIRRTDIRAINIQNPFFTTISFAPTTVVADTATPGFLSSDASEAPGAVPSLYTTKFSQWTLPYTVTFYRGSTKNGPQAGKLTVKVYPSDPDATGERKRVVSVVGDNQGLPAQNFYVSSSPTTQRIFVKTPNLTFLMDPARGRVETGFPPLAGDTTGAPLVDIGGSIQPMTPTTSGTPADLAFNYGELVPTVFRINTRRPDAGMADSSGNGYIVPSNQGFLNIRLLTNQQANQNAVDETSGISPGRNYYLQRDINNFLTAGQTPDNGDYPSPRAVFGYMLIAPGTERVLGPTSTYVNAAYSENVSYFRLPTFSDPTLARTVYFQTGITPPIYRDFTVSRPSYYFDYDLPPTDMLRFANQPATQLGDNSGVPGVPATTTGTTKELRVTYLWQNNFARKILQGDAPIDAPIGTPLDANGNSNVSTADLGRTAGAPEPDVVKVDYSTRSVFAVTVGARVYDSGTGEAQYIQLADKIQINNVGR
jgi:prepilin-type N-terminal cleavage/methylation domain-containing protein